jgi:hypothetical protein
MIFQIPAGPFNMASDLAMLRTAVHHLDRLTDPEFFPIVCEAHGRIVNRFRQVFVGASIARIRHGGRLEHRSANDQVDAGMRDRVRSSLWM